VFQKKTPFPLTFVFSRGGGKEGGGAVLEEGRQTGKGKKKKGGRSVVDYRRCTFRCRLLVFHGGGKRRKRK